MLSGGTDAPGKPRRRQESTPHIRIKVLPFRMEATVAKRVDEARRRLGLSSRSDLFRCALRDYFFDAGEVEVAKLLLPDGAN